MVQLVRTWLLLAQTLNFCLEMETNFFYFVFHTSCCQLCWIYCIESVYTKSNLTFSPLPLASLSIFYHAVPLCLPVMLSRILWRTPSFPLFFLLLLNSPPSSLFAFFSNDPNSPCFRAASSSPSFSAADLLHSTAVSISMMHESTSVASLPEVLATTGFYSSLWSWFFGQDFYWTVPSHLFPLIHFQLPLLPLDFCCFWCSSFGVLCCLWWSLVVEFYIFVFLFVVLGASCSLSACISVCC